uniref:Uncharacterized protein n=1 Tax=Nelumbo nucifera TaxID=4432 RepID=A0A822XK00_NELNU|nr:TPA_asm: hypothetical protein HUJ06_020924 [Nelumbo nucifera]
MIYRKWSLLTGPVSILGSIVATVVVANYLFVDNLWIEKDWRNELEKIGI